MNHAGLYIHIPFCKSKCLYCDFNSFAKKEDYIAPYFSALLREAKAWGSKLKDYTFDTIYFGGGTPSFVPADLLASFITSLKDLFTFSKDLEITVECNPATINEEGFEKLKLVGVNRISIGLQSTCDKDLKILGRLHSFKDFEACFLAARRAGFNNISLDLMYGLPDMTLTHWETVLDKALSFGAEHISAYALKIENGTPFSKMELNLPSEDLCADMYELMVKKLLALGHPRYEISNFSKKGYASRHNQKYWSLDDFLGLGAGAYSFISDKRFSNHEGLCDYISATEKTGFAVCEETQLSEKDLMSEFVFLGLRLEKGISLKEFESRFQKSLFDVFCEPIKKYTSFGFLILEDGRLRFSEKGFFVSNTILADFV